MTHAEYEHRVLSLLGKQTSRLLEMQNLPGYVREFTYSGSTSNVIEIKHYSTSDNLIAPVVETIEYQNATVEGSRVTKITIS